MTPAFSPPASERLAGLAERCEAASGPDREIDLRIAMLFDPDWTGIYEGNVPGYVKHGTHAAYTASLDAAMSLVPEGMWRRINIDPNRRANIRLGDACAVTAATPALALCAAALRANAHQETRP